MWVKKPKEQVKPNIEGMRGIKVDKGVNWATKDLEPGKSSNIICAIDSTAPCSSFDDIHT